MAHSLTRKKEKSCIFFPYQEVKSGIYHEVAELEDKGRLKFHTQTQIKESLNTLVRFGYDVVIDVDISLRSRIALDFSQKGNTS